MNLLLVIVILHYAIHFGHCTVVIDFDETIQTENMVNLNGISNLYACIVHFVSKYHGRNACNTIHQYDGNMVNIQPYGTIHCFHYYCLLGINEERRKTS